MRLTFVLFALLTGLALANSTLFVLNMAPWYVDFFGPMAPSAVSASLVVGVILLPLYLAGRTVLSLRRKGRKPKVVRTMIGVAMVTQFAIGAVGTWATPTTLSELWDDQGMWVADWIGGAELRFELDGGDPTDAQPTKWKVEAPQAPPAAAGNPKQESEALTELVEGTETAGGASRYLDNESSAGLGVRWLVMARHQFADAWAADPKMAARMTAFYAAWKLPIDGTSWNDLRAIESLVVPEGQRFLLQVDLLASALSEDAGDARAMPPLVPWRDLLASGTPQRQDGIWVMSLGRFRDIVGAALDADRDYEALYDGPDAQHAKWFLTKPDPKFTGSDIPTRQAFLTAARGERSLHWLTPGAIGKWPDSLTQSSAGRQAARVIAMLSGKDENAKKELLKRHHLPLNLDVSDPPDELTPKRGRRVLKAVCLEWAQQFDSVLTPEQLIEAPFDERKRRADTEAREWALSAQIKVLNDTQRAVLWQAEGQNRSVTATLEDDEWRFDWP